MYKKSELKIICKYILNRELGVVASPDKEFLISIFKKHYYYEKIFGNTEPVVISVIKDNYSNNCFTLFNKKGKNYDFSYLKAIDGDDNINKKINMACRNSIRNQIIEFKDNDKSEFCAISKEKLEKDYHVDHTGEYEFRHIVEKWLTDVRLQYIIKNNIIMKKDQAYIFKDKKIEKSFQDFHKELAVLQKVNAEYNLKKVKK